VAMRLGATDQGEYALLDIREIALSPGNG